MGKSEGGKSLDFNEIQSRDLDCYVRGRGRVDTTPRTLRQYTVFEAILVIAFVKAVIIFIRKVI